MLIIIIIIIIIIIFINCNWFITLSTKCVYGFSPQLFYEILLIIRRIQLDIIINVCRYSRKVSVILVRF